MSKTNTKNNESGASKVLDTAADSAWADDLNREEAIAELKERVKLIHELRRHRDSLLEVIAIFTQNSEHRQP